MHAIILPSMNVWSPRLPWIRHSSLPSEALSPNPLQAGPTTSRECNSPLSEHTPQLLESPAPHLHPAHEVFVTILGQLNRRCFVVGLLPRWRECPKRVTTARTPVSLRARRGVYLVQLTRNRSRTAGAGVRPGGTRLLLLQTSPPTSGDERPTPPWT